MKSICHARSSILRFTYAAFNILCYLPYKSVCIPYSVSAGKLKLYIIIFTDICRFFCCRFKRHRTFAFITVIMPYSHKCAYCIK